MAAEGGARAPSQMGSRCPPPAARLTGCDDATHDPAASARRLYRPLARRKMGRIRMGRRHFLALACIAVALCPLTAAAEETIKIGFPMPLSGPTAVYGAPITKGAEMA